jgi:hypothetical protein
MTNDDKETIRAQRRRRAGPGDSGERERAAAPQRQRPPSTSTPSGRGTTRPSGSSGTSRPYGTSGTSQSYGGSGGGGIPVMSILNQLLRSGGSGGGKPKLLTIIILGGIVLCVACALIYFVSGGLGNISLPDSGEYTYDYPLQRDPPPSRQNLPLPHPSFR